MTTDQRRRRNANGPSGFAGGSAPPAPSHRSVGLPARGGTHRVPSGEPLSTRARVVAAVQPTSPEAGPGAARGSWRDVTLRQYRRWNLLSTLVGVAMFAFGLWYLTHFRLVLGLFLLAAGSCAALWTAALRIDGTPGPLYRSSLRDTERWAPRALHFYTRRNCSLCDEARARLAHDLAPDITIVDHDVDNHPALAARYGDRVPVAVFEGGEVFALRYDAEAVRLLGGPGGGSR